MFQRLLAIIVVHVWACALFSASAVSQEALHERAPEAAPQAASGVEYINIVVESAPLTVRARGMSEDRLEIFATPIFEALNSRSESQGSILGYWRHQDGAVMSLDMSDGKVRANGVVLGALPGHEPRETADGWLGVNAISVLTGTIVSGDATSGLVFQLDERLRPQFDLELFVNGARVEAFGVEPRTVGPVLILPLRPIAQSLGHDVSFDAVRNIVTVRRAQDGVIVTLELTTGLVTVNGTPRGVSANMSYVEVDDLLLPFSAIETLTGTHVELAPGSSRVNVNLDDRLFGAVLPGERVDEDAAATGFTPERLDFQIGSEGPQRFELSSRYRGFNARSRYETVGGIGDEPEAWQAAWISTDIQSLEGWIGGVGDYSPTLRELSGIDEGRIRGVHYKDRLENGDVIAIAAGAPLSGSEPITERASRPVFGGFAAGARLIRAHHGSEYGLSAKVSEDGQDSRIVASGQTDTVLNADEDGEGVRFYAAYDAGAFETAQRSGVDVRAQTELRYSINPQIGVSARAAYEGEKFAVAQAIDTDEVIDDLSVGPIGPRTTGAVSTDWRTFKNWGVIQNIAAGARASFSHVGGDEGVSTRAFDVSAQARIGAGGPDISINAGTSTSDVSGETSNASALSARIIQRFDRGRVQAVYSRSTIDGVADDRVIATASMNPVTRALGKGASLSAAPTATVLWSEAESSARLGVFANAQSGQLFGDKFRVQGQFSALSSVDPENNDTRFFGSLNAVYDLFRNVQLQLGYFDDFAGRRDMTIGLRGSIQFNEQRKHTAPQEGRGVLMGRVFFDENRDGVRQPHERGLAGVRVEVSGTRLGLGVDRAGAFTIQNLRSGLYDLKIDRRTLPLGYLIPQNAEPRVTIGEARITRIDIPVVASGQIRGAVFVDENGDGKADVGEFRLEGHMVRLTSLDGAHDSVIQTAAFGQYGFENLMPGRYALEVSFGGRAARRIVDVNEASLFTVQSIAVPPA